MKTALFDFELPPERIATHPVEPRDASKLLVVRPDALEDLSVRDLPDLLRPGDLMVFNDTRVIPARLRGKRGNASIEIMLHRYRGDKCWHAFARPAKRLSNGEQLWFSNCFTATVKSKNEDGSIIIKFNEANWHESLLLEGEMPLPHYMKRSEEVSDKKTYQTVYAQKEGAVAAPTAGLHFTKDLLEAIVNKGINQAFVTLHVGAGTFQPVKAEDTDNHVMHSEYFEISETVAHKVNQTHQTGGRVIAVGTTTLRVLESATDETGQVRPMQGETQLFITPGYRFKSVNMLMTNFHLPKSTLFMLVSAFAGLERMKAAYQHAMAANYRFYSYGDACLLIR